MTLEDLYEDLKVTLDMFGLRWNQKDQIEVTVVSKNVITYTHGGVIITKDYGSIPK